MEGLRFEVSRIAVIEKPPICRTVLVEEENIVRPYYLAFPWQVFVINKIGYMGEHWLNDLYLGFRNTSMTQEDQMLCWPNLWNVYNNLCVCYPTINKEKGTKGIEEFYKGVLNDFWSSVWRLSRGLHVGYKHCYAPGLRDITGPDWKLWQEKTKEDPSFITKVQWPEFGNLDNFAELYNDT